MTTNSTDAAVRRIAISPKSAPTGLRGRDKVRVVCIDLSNAYRAMIRRWFPNALIVADRFHAIRLAGLHLLRVARQLCPQLGWNRTWLGVLRLRQLLTNHSPQLRPVYDMKEHLHALLGLKRLARQSCRPAASLGSSRPPSRPSVRAASRPL